MKLKAALILTFALVAAACSGSDAPAPSAAPSSPVSPPTTVVPTAAPTAPPPPTTLAPIPIVPAADLHRFARLFLARRQLPDLLSLIRSMGATEDPRWAPYLLDLRLVAAPEAFEEMKSALASISGLAPPETAAQLFLQYGGWMYDERIDPGEEYVQWKAELYGLIDSGFADLILQIDDPVLAGQLQWGGTTIGGIPELNDQRTISIDEADYMLDDELTFGAVINGRARSYPHRILDFHELANDTLGGEPVALANCTLCRTGMLFSRRVGDRVLEFQTSGLLWNSNKVMVDRQTGTLWRQLTGEAIAGELEGTVLDVFPLTVTLFGDWTAEHPDSDVVAIPGGGRTPNTGEASIPVDVGYSYEPNDAYNSYYRSEELWFPSFDVPDAFDPKAQVATLDLDGARLAVGIEALAAAGPRVLEIGSSRALAVSTGSGARFYSVPDAMVLDIGDDGTVLLPVDAIVGEDSLVIPGSEPLPRLASSQSFWFAWYGTFPDTTWWPSA
jgi:hypothetical protein